MTAYDDLLGNFKTQIEGITPDDKPSITFQHYHLPLDGASMGSGIDRRFNIIPTTKSVGPHHGVPGTITFTQMVTIRMAWATERDFLIAEKRMGNDVNKIIATVIDPANYTADTWRCVDANFSGAEVVDDQLWFGDIDFEAVFQYVQA